MKQSIARNITNFKCKEITDLFKKVKCSFCSESFKILYGPRQRSFARVLVIASRKVGNAPARNQIKRRLRAVFYENRLYEKPYDFIVIIRAEACSLSFEALRALFMEGIKRC
jgi:ribonuclease P protein component